MIDGQAIAAQPIAEAALRRLGTEHGGSRPGGTRAEETGRAGVEPRVAPATRP